MRTANPLLSRDDIKSMLLDHANNKPCVGGDSKCGAGIPDAAKAVTSALGGFDAINRLTPLFTFYSSAREDHLYTVVPQMATSALLGMLQPMSYTTTHTAYTSIGVLSPGYSWFKGLPVTICSGAACDAYYPKASMSVFTTFKNPVAPLPELVPLYRLSRPCSGPSDQNCPNHEHVSHAYSTDLSTETWIQNGYRLDGIEGYIFPKTFAQPSGTVKVCRKYYGLDANSVLHDDYILFPGTGPTGTDCSSSTDGYTTTGNVYTQNVYGDNWIGWAYIAREPRTLYGGAANTILNSDD
jgi:hypothetical protein